MPGPSSTYWPNGTGYSQMTKARPAVHSSLHPLTLTRTNGLYRISVLKRILNALADACLCNRSAPTFTPRCHARFAYETANS